ncbi:MAG: YcxB family protein [Clostridiales bacterium]|uniref:YcxB family protein n=1 Tax=Flavonifractor porci TaxID=3133422 RepID=UPI003096C217|nr:YcxB family protein [Clostridiales bacterium]
MEAQETFVLQSRYDINAYQAMARGTWKLFQKHRMEVMAYPALFSIGLLILVLLVYNWSAWPIALRVGGIVFAVLQFAVIPLGAMRAQRKTCRKAIKAAKSRGQYPSTVTFTFRRDDILATVGEESASVRYADVTHLAALKQWRLLYFTQGAYMIPVSAFSDPRELDRFDGFLTQKCNKPIYILEGKIPAA